MSAVRHPPAFLVLAGGAAAVAVSLPLLYLLITVGGSLGEAIDTVATSRTLALTARSVGLALAVAVAATALAVPLAWLTTRTDLPGRRMWAVAAALPLVIPSYIGAYAILSALGPAGLLRDALQGPFGVERLPDITGFFGAWLVLTLFTYPLVLLPARVALRGLDPQLEEVALSLGRSRWQTFRSVILPQLAPAIGAGAVLVALYVLHDFGAVSILRFDSFTREIYTSYRASFDRTGAAALALILVALMLVLLWLEGLVGRGVVLHRSTPGAVRRAPIVPLGRWKLPALSFCALVCSLALALPALVLVYWSLKSFAGSTDLGEIASAAGGSLLLSGAAAAAAALCALPIAVLSVRFPGLASRMVERLGHTGYALPGIVVALALVFFATRAMPAVYQTLGLLVFAFVVLFLPLAIASARATLQQVPPSLEEAARTMGRSPLEVLRTVTAPLMAGGIGAGAALVFLTAIKELPATLILAPTGFETLATEIWTATSVGFFERGAVPSLVLLAISAPSLYFLLDD
ncbi:MAG: iron ABC transporter permease [Solirubrobacterales bacterium]|nr:iron ABC transporter permease [Solirubrobacterales bacterium]